MYRTELPTVGRWMRALGKAEDDHIHVVAAAARGSIRDDSETLRDRRNTRPVSLLQTC